MAPLLRNTQLGRSMKAVIYPEDLDLSFPLRQKLKEWLSKYQNEHYNGFINEDLIKKLDQEGKDIAIMIKKELSEVKMEYFSDARMTNEII
ncbi:hypothetical protein FAZ19_21800 [Sphingobacterium alkalisoli]|uniref:Uncharacterized protein n=1 Tax=Sphingobacterium alkalisoli TaxID=1874115 RepID=A0A4U0GUY8_9SPHI|nr:hypothetical protein [Sphingobacterium alkalisoli]TJY61532.1 hypothetical protein FAZ19_21800 [Sphingobacterium alkalisoli]GGH29810.1 hypothetical protein GCM10011418_41400 [Sphingobacterium alkalisoli]